MHGNVIYDPSDKAFTFDGADDMIDIPIPRFMLGDPELTVSIWVRPQTLPSGSWDMYAHVGRNTTNQQVQITYYDGSGGLHIGGYGQNIQISGGYTLNPGSWYHLCMTIQPGAWSTSTKKLYVNGYLVSGQYLNNSGTTNISDDDRSRISFGGLVREDRTIDHGAHCFMSNMKVYDTALTAQEVKILYDMGRMGGKVNPQPLHIDTPVHINAPLYAPGTILNISQFVDSTSRTVSNNNSTIQTGYTTPAVPMKAGSKVKLEFHIPYRQDGGSGWKGGYHWIYFRLNKTVAGVAANTWVFLLTSGYHMDHASSVISNYSNSCYLPLSVPEDFTIEFQHRWRPYENTSEVMYINGGHHINITTDSNLLDLGFAYNNMGWSKYIITEISK
tara:strand:+ start:487 stop:1647 length:1161 start_codon:yes stop_codon:yes gene_type:complete